MQRVFRIFCVLGLTIPVFSQAGLVDELSETQIKRLNQTKDVVIQEPVEGNPWPRAKIYRLVDATPKQVAAVFFDYNAASSYMPDLLESTISQKTSPSVMEVDYRVNVPFLPDECYTVRNSLRPVSNGAYQIDWKLLKATTTQDSVGSFQVEPYSGKSLLCYENFVVPGAKMAGLLRRLAIERMRDTVTALANQVETLKDKDPEALNRQVQSLDDALPVEIADAH